VESIQLKIQSLLSWSRRHKYWLLVSAWLLGSILFFLMNAEPFSARVRATGSFGISLGLSIIIVAILAHEIGPYLQHFQQQVVQPLAFHLWRYRWIYLIVPLVVVSCAGLSVDDNGHSQSSIPELGATKQSPALFVLFAAILLMWLISIFYAFCTVKLQWLVALLFFPPLALIFFFHGKEVENQSKLSQSVERFLDGFATHLWLHRWAWTCMVALAFSALCFFSVLTFFKEGSAHSNSVLHCFLIALLAAVVWIWISVYFKAWAARKYLRRLGIILCPPLAFVFFYLG